MSDVKLNTLNLSLYENYVYKFEKVDGQYVRKKIYLMIINQDLFYFKDKTIDKIRNF
jgi:hypothetical protein